MPSTRGRRVEVPLTNKSGGGVVAGDVVIIDSANDSAFTTTTVGRAQVSVGIAMETIANNATGRILVHGEAPLINVPASVTRGHYIETHTVAKQATGSSTRRSGSFGQFMTGGTTPKGWIWGFPDNAGATGETVATSAIWTTAGKIARATGTGTATEQWPPGHEFDYAQITSGVNPTATTEGTANTLITGNSFTADGQAVVIEVFSPSARADASAAARTMTIVLFEQATVVGNIGFLSTPAASNDNKPLTLKVRHTPSAGSRQYIVKAYVSAGTGNFSAGAGGTGANVPAYLRVTKA